ncbi:MAG: 4Fe-4S binding protein [Thermodesulfobacteriota bacterium]
MAAPASMEPIRKWVQLLWLFLSNGSWSFPVTRTIYQGPLKAICAPGLNCYSCPAATTACPIGSLQHLMAAARETLAAGQLFLGGSVVGAMGVLGALVGRMVCGWACPFGLIQELLYKIPSRKLGVPRPLGCIKYGMLALLVLVLPALAVDQFGYGSPWFCKLICPAGTLEAGLPMLILQPALTASLGLLFYSKLFILAFFTSWSVLASRPFCRTTCPLGAFYALFSRVSLVRLRHDAQACTQCGACHQVCPMGVRFNESPDDAECIRCLRCMQEACRFGAIRLEIGGVPVGDAGRPQPAAPQP